jgi:DNA polymerase I-like protein with 3'-5' exonuclease and polymerase domains/5'-3' exonuclease
MNKPEFDRLLKRPRVILDVKGLLMNSWFTGKDPDAIQLPDNKTLNTAGYALQVVLDKFILPAMNNTFSPIDVVAVWEGGNHYRKTIFPNYKKQRTEEKETALPRIKQELKLMEDIGKRLFASLGMINVWVDGVEGDDVIAALCSRLAGNKVVYTNDSDILQLSSKENMIFLIGREGVLEDGEYEDTLFRHLALRKSIVGDPTDEYPGVKGLGKVAWAELHNQYGLDGLDELDSIVKARDWNNLNACVAGNESCKLLRKLWDNREEWAVQYDLAIQHPELCWGFRGSKKIEPVFYTRPPNRDVCADLLGRVGIGHMMEDLEQFFGINSLVTLKNHDHIVGHLNTHLLEGPVVAFDYETYDSLKHPGFIEALSPQSKSKGYVDVLSQRLTGGSLTYGNNLQHNIYIPVLHKDTEAFPLLLESTIKKLIAAGKPMVAHNTAFEEQVTLQCMGIQFNGLIDTAITQSYVAEEEEVGLKDLTRNQLGMKQTDYDTLMKQYGVEDMRGLTGEQVLQYALEDSIGSAHLFKLHNLIMQLEGTAEFYYTNESFVVHPLNRSFEAGKKIDFVAMDKLRAADEIVVREGREKIRAMLEEHCSEEKPEHAKALFEADYDYLKCKMRVAADKGGWSRDKYKEKLRQIEMRYTTATAYHPFTESRKPVECSGTPGEVNSAAHLIGLPSLEALTTPKVIDWLMGMEPEQRRLPLPTLLSTAMKNLAKYRKLVKDNPVEADELYPEVKAFMVELHPILEANSPMVTEGDELNFGSPKQMQELLYLKLGLPVRERNFPKRGSFRHIEKLEGAPSTNDEAVEAAKLYDCPEGDWRREFLKIYTTVKEADTRESLYYRPYPHWVHPRDGAIHPGIINCGTATRRPTGTSPNILQVSKGPVRTCFVPRYEGHCIITADFNGQELRLTASESGDPVMIGAYVGLGQYVDKHGSLRTTIKDIHSVTSCTFAKRVVRNECGPEAEALLLLNDAGFVDYDFFVTVRNHKDTDPPIPVFGDMTSKVVKAFNLARAMAKVVNFLIIYGGNHRTLAKKLGLPEDFAELLMTLVFKAYARLAPWQREVIDRAIRDGYVTTAFGNWKHVSEDLRSKDRGLRQRAERQTVNHTIQGAAAEILKIVLRRCHEEQLFEETGSVLIAPVYDEIAASVPIRNAVEYCARLQPIMNLTPPGHPVPMLAEICIGKNWGSVIELHDNPCESLIEKTLEECFA